MTKTTKSSPGAISDRAWGLLGEVCEVAALLFAAWVLAHVGLELLGGGL